MSIKATRSYRCSYHPHDRHGVPVTTDSGVLPFVQLKALSAEDAQRKAQAVTGQTVVNVERLDGAVVAREAA